ncbi:hypothetical protein HC028_10150 [Planosporangium flavigriseum]|uniref:Lipoprotein n=1 Tax=Planosporangium flavigriseum TaxID=373681 RepID=A0A8J3LLD8_9ACTN|nr:hypothetical protein [Planosporangium flavigriseum]NJC64861.1 hypothetical protein [Planosporangium flavigriseum]GIG72733.1 hypothetical protein Pfl04_11370 [Planosporangium flavigriseum]
MRLVPARPAAAQHNRRRAVAALVTAALGTLTGCGSISDAQQVMDRAHLVNELASRLDHASELTYTAEYQLPGGGRATIAQAQRPLRTVYIYPGGKFATTPDATIDCGTDSGAATCTLTAPPSPSTDATTLVNALRDRGVAPPTLVVGLLTAASLSSNTQIQQHDTTLAGEHSTCVNVAGVENSAASQFDACITSAGVLGSFKGTVDNKKLDISLISYAASVAADAFDVPTGVKIVDQRPKIS